MGSTDSSPPSLSPHLPRRSSTATNSPAGSPQDTTFSSLQLLREVQNFIGNVNFQMPPGVVGKEKTYPFGLDNGNIKEFLCLQDLDLGWANLAIMCLHRLCIETGKSDIYGFLCPSAVQEMYNTEGKRTEYVGNAIRNSKLPCYLSPIIENNHWSLCVACPMDNTVYWFDSLGHGPSDEMKSVFNTAFETYYMVGDKRKRDGHATWIESGIHSVLNNHQIQSVDIMFSVSCMKLFKGVLLKICQRFLVRHNLTLLMRLISFETY